VTNVNTSRPAFSTPLEVITFIKQCCELNDATRLYDACSYPPDDFWREHLFADLCAIEVSETLAKIFLRDGQITAFPADVAAFKLGGHDQRTRHLHIDLEQVMGHWYLQKIWKCR